MNGERLSILHGAPLRLRVEDAARVQEWSSGSVRSSWSSSTGPMAKARAAGVRTGSTTARMRPFNPLKRIPKSCYRLWCG